MSDLWQTQCVSFILHGMFKMTAFTNPYHFQVALIQWCIVPFCPAKDVLKLICELCRQQKIPLSLYPSALKGPL